MIWTRVFQYLGLCVERVADKDRGRHTNVVHPRLAIAFWLKSLTLIPATMESVRQLFTMGFKLGLGRELGVEVEDVDS